jgi:hypothetical protein
MMIDGAHEGAFATHPTIAERVAAIISVTGAMALIAPGRRDTRSPGLNAGEGFARRSSSPGLEAVSLLRARQNASAALARVSSGHNEFNRLGLTREMSVGAVAAVGVFVWIHSADLGNPAALIKAFDPAPMRTLFAAAGEVAQCERQGIGWYFGLAAKPTGCDEVETKLRAHHGENGLFGKLAEGKWPDGSFRSAGPAIVQLAEIRESRCFQTQKYSVGDRGLHALTYQPTHGDDIDLPGYLAHTDSAARSVVEAATPADRDLRLLDYFKVRKTMFWVIHRFFGDPGLELAAVRTAGPEHQAAIALLRERLTDPDFASALSPLERAELDVLAAAPQDFISCTARRAQGQNKG